MADIESMCYQGKVSKDDCDCLRFYWWLDGDVNSRPKVFRMLVHIFGAVSSPSCIAKYRGITRYRYQTFKSIKVSTDDWIVHF